MEYSFGLRETEGTSGTGPTSHGQSTGNMLSGGGIIREELGTFLSSAVGLDKLRARV